MATAKDTTVSQSDFVKKYAQKHGLDEKSARATVKGVLEMITDEVAEGNKVTFLGFGAFSPKFRPARKARNPKTQEELNVPASTVPYFSASKTFKDKVGQAHNGAAETV
ncbi:probable DNA-binding protein HU [Coccomyxa sp. Obi]|nr:probable DNA-binding protein HU [Coccomyxa sp. Obi]